MTTMAFTLQTTPQGDTKAQNAYLQRNMDEIKALLATLTQRISPEFDEGHASEIVAHRHEERTVIRG